MANLKQFEIRRDIITDSQVIVYIGDKSNLSTNKEKKYLRSKSKNCNYCNPTKAEMKDDILIYRDKKQDWTLRVKKYEDSIFEGYIDSKSSEKGPYQIEYKGIGHEIIINQAHDDDLNSLNTIAIAEIIDSIHERYISLMKEKEYKYISISKKVLGNSNISHPLFHLHALPFIPHRVNNIIKGSQVYYQKAKRCPYCVAIDFELEGRRERVIKETQYFLSYCPFASSRTFEINIIPKDHQPSLETLNDEEKIDLAKIIKATITSLNSTLKEPGYQLSINTAPIDGQDYNYFHWNISIIPNPPVRANFDYGTDINICLVKPEEAAKYLREASSSIK